MLAQGYKKVLKFGFSGVLFLLIAIYAFFQTKSLIFGVKLDINGLTNGESYNTPLLSISGEAKNAVNFTVNGRKIFIDKKGNWQDQLLLNPGYNIISFEAKDKFEHNVKKDYQLYLRPATSS